MKKEPKHKRTIGKKIHYLRIFILIFLIAIISVSIHYLKIYFDAKKHVPKYENTISNKVDNDIVDNSITDENNVENTVSPDEIVDTSYIPNDMGGYGVVGRLVIDKIGVDLNILEKYDETSLNLSVVKFYGSNINEIGNFCILGHNYKRLLKRQKELEIGDTFYLISKETGVKVTYQIYDKYSCWPNQTECLYPPTEQRREVTLITCDPGGATRLICKAKEI